MVPEIFFGVTLLALGGLVVWMRPSKKLGTLLLLTTASGCALVFLLVQPRAKVFGERTEEMKPLPDQGRPGGYVTSDTCASCHPSQYESWRRSYHRTMTQAATPENAKAEFHGHVLAWAGESYSLQQEGESFWTYVLPVSTNPTEAQTMAPDRKQIDMITGSHHMQVYWMDAGYGNLQVGFPFTWLNNDHRWVPRGDTFLRDPDSPPPVDVWNTTCIRCHATAPQSRPDKAHERYNTRVGELGIACEACHGPGEAHLAANQNPIRRMSLHLGAKADSTIVQPGRLDHVRASQVCGNCHSMKWFEANEEWRQNGFTYLPGDDLNKLNPVIRPKHLNEIPAAEAVINRHPEMISDFFWPDGMIRVSGREYNGLLETPCYQKGQLSCLSCHSLHKSDPANQLAASMEGNEACLQCHTKMRTNLAAHTHHTVGSSGSLCYNCHMPYTTYGLLKGIRSHQIDSPSVKVAKETGRPDACSLCHLDRPLSWSAEHLSRWYQQKPVTLDADEQTVSAAVLWLLRGDAGQRVIIASSMGRPSSRQASGEGWMAPYLGILLNDRYSAVRYVAGRSLKQIREFSNLDYDFVGDPEKIAVISEQVIQHWNHALGPISPKARSELLIGADGQWRESEVRRLLATRDNRPVHLRE